MRCDDGDWGLGPGECLLARGIGCGGTPRSFGERRRQPLAQLDRIIGVEQPGVARLADLLLDERIMSIRPQLAEAIVVEEADLAELVHELVEILALDRDDPTHRQGLAHLREGPLTVEGVEHGLVDRVDREGITQREGIAEHQQRLVATAHAKSLESTQLGPVHRSSTMPDPGAERQRPRKTRYHRRVRAMIVALTLFAGPAEGPGKGPGKGPVAVEWRGEEAPDERLRTAVREAVAEVDGRPIGAVSDRALERARVAVSREHPATIRELRATLRVGLDEADAAYREGRFVDAQRLLEQLLAELHDHPEVPGAAASAREAHLLAARIAWAQADPVRAEQALMDALRLDPEARLSARRAPPELVERYEALQAAMLGAREQDWVTPQLDVEGSTPDAFDVAIEIDGVLGLRPVPPGAHFVVVFHDGHEPSAAFRSFDTEWSVASSPERISSDPDVEHQAICEALALEVLVLAERRGTDVGIQGYRCGIGYGPLWTGKREGLSTAAATILAGPFDARAATLMSPWSSPIRAPIPEIEVTTPPTRPWYRRGWIWGTSAGVAGAIAGGVVAGVLLGGRRSQPSSLEIDADTFIGGTTP